jgi:hypothetical protein
MTDQATTQTTDQTLPRDHSVPTREQMTYLAHEVYKWLYSLPEIELKEILGDCGIELELVERVSVSSS